MPFDEKLLQVGKPAEHRKRNAFGASLPETEGLQLRRQVFDPPERLQLDDIHGEPRQLWIVLEKRKIRHRIGIVAISPERHPGILTHEFRNAPMVLRRKRVAELNDLANRIQRPQLIVGHG